MNIKNQVCSIEQAKTLKFLGVKQETLTFWGYLDYPANDNGDFAKDPSICLYTPLNNNPDGFIMHFIEKENADYHWSEGTHDNGADHSRCELTREDYAAFTVAEMGSMLGEFMPSWLIEKEFGVQTWVTSTIEDDGIERDEDLIKIIPEFNRFDQTEAQSRSSLLIDLISNEIEGYSIDEVNKRLTES